MKAHHIIRHGVDFLLLACVLAFGLVGMVYFKFDVASQIAVVVLMGMLYVFWGVFHHLHEANLTAHVVLEYIAVACLVDFILIIFLLRV